VKRELDHSSACQFESFNLGSEASLENFGVERILKAEAHEDRVVVLDVHVELADILAEEFHNLTVV